MGTDSELKKITLNTVCTVIKGPMLCKCMLTCVDL